MTTYALDPSTQDYIDQRAAEIHAMLRRTAQDIVDIGGKLADVKARLDHGQFGAWLEQEFQWKERMARNFMAVHARFKTANFTDLAIAPSALYLLASPSVPEDTAQAVIERAQAGETITFSLAKEAINRVSNAYKAAPEPVREVVRRYGVADADTISELTRLHRNKAETFAEVAASGWIQPGDEEAAVRIDAGALKVREALRDKAQTHRLLAADERRESTRCPNCGFSF